MLTPRSFQSIPTAPPRMLRMANVADGGSPDLKSCGRIVARIRCYTQIKNTSTRSGHAIEYAKLVEKNATERDPGVLG